MYSHWLLIHLFTIGLGLWEALTTLLLGSVLASYTYLYHRYTSIINHAESGRIKGDTTTCC